jgi:hypothetical protein
MFPIIIFAICMMLCLTDRHAYADEAPRVQIQMFKYSSVEKAEQHAEIFKHVLQTKIYNMVEDLQSRGRYFDYLNSLRIVPQEKNLLFSPAELSNFWKESHALEILSGLVHLKGDTVTVYSQVYLGDLNGSLRKKHIDLEMSIAPGNFRFNNDSHSLITLYALAMDAKRRNLPSDVVASYLSKAHEIAQDLQTALPGDLKDAVEKALEELKTVATK